jgi:hypothetical protein
VVWQDDEAVKIDLDAGGSALVIRSQLIEEDLPGKKQPTHISVDLANPAKEASLKSVIRPDLSGREGR